MARKELRTVGVGCGLVLLLVLLVVVYAWLKLARHPHSHPCYSTRDDIERIAAGARQYYVTDHWDENGNLLPKAFPANITRTPARIDCDRETIVPQTTWDTNGWGPVHFAPAWPRFNVYCTYSFHGTGVGKTSRFTTRIRCPACDWVPRLLEAKGHIDDAGTVRTFFRTTNCNWRGIHRDIHEFLHHVSFGLISDPDVREWGDEPPPVKANVRSACGEPIIPAPTVDPLPRRTDRLSVTFSGVAPGAARLYLNSGGDFAIVPVKKGGRFRVPLKLEPNADNAVDVQSWHSSGCPGGKLIIHIRQGAAARDAGAGG